MSWLTNPLVVGVRRLTRRMGLNHGIATLLSRRGYEDRFEAALLAAIRPGDCVWDVGANVGHYTRQFAARTGAGGTVVAFEPGAATFTALRERCGPLDNVKLLPIGLGETDGILRLVPGLDALGATSSFRDDADGIPVMVRSGDALIRDRAVPPPDVAKIDVEGFEVEVLRGLASYLASGGLRALGLEVHFEQLAARGTPRAPAAIEAMLRDNGFRVSWPDYSHLIASRR